MQRKPLFSVVRLFALLFLVLPMTAPAQENSGTLAETWVMTVKQGQQANFEAAFIAHQAVRIANGDPRAWDVFTPETGENLNNYIIRTCCFAWADQDAYTSWNESNSAVMGDWFANVDQYVESYAHYFSEVDRDHSNWPADSRTVRYIGVTDYYPSLEQAAAFNAARKELSQVALNQGWSAAGHQWAWADRIGGKPVSSLVVPFSSYADMASEGESFVEFAERTMGGENATDAFKRFTSSAHGSIYTIYRHRADLSTPMGD